MIRRRLYALIVATVSLAGCLDSTAPAPSPFAPGELRAVVTALDTAGGTDPGPYTAAAAMAYAEQAGTIRLDSVITTPGIAGALGGTYRALAVLMNLKTTTSGSATSDASAFIAVIGWNGFNAATGTVNNVFVVSLNASALLPAAGTAPPTPLDGVSGFATIASRASAARFYADSGTFSATRWSSGTPTLCIIPGGAFGDLCNHALGTLDGSFSFNGTAPSGGAQVAVRPVSLVAVPLVVMNWFASL
jgi:hypothetical protein